MLGHSLRRHPVTTWEVATGLNNLDRSFEKEGGPGVRPGTNARWMEESNRVGSGRVEPGETRERNGSGNGIDQRINKPKVPIDTKRTHLRVAVQWCVCRPRSSYDQYRCSVCEKHAVKLKSVRQAPPVTWSAVRKIVCVPGVSQQVGRGHNDNGFHMQSVP